jgi:hypothetical protein
MYMKASVVTKFYDAKRYKNIYNRMQFYNFQVKLLGRLFKAYTLCCFNAIILSIQISTFSVNSFLVLDNSTLN